MQEKSKFLSVRLTAEEREHLDRLAKESGLSLSNVIRSCINRTEIRQRQPAEINDLYRRIRERGSFCILVILNFEDTLGVMSSISTGYMSCFFNFWKLSSLMTCSIRQASASAVFGSTPAAIRRSVKKRCFS